MLERHYFIVLCNTDTHAFCMLLVSVRNHAVDDNKADEYLNLFRANVGGWEYIESFLLRSYEETMEFIANPYNKAREGDYPWEEGIRLLKEFWEKYPNGGIYFG